MINEERIAELEAELDACQRLLKLSGSVNRNLMAESEDRYERLQAAESKLNESSSHCKMGVGDGSGNLFVHGDYESIKAAQTIIVERDALIQSCASAARFNEELNSKLNEMAQIEPFCRVIRYKNTNSWYRPEDGFQIDSDDPHEEELYLYEHPTVAQSNADKVEIDKTLVKFLNGEGEFNGLWFGEKKDGEVELKPFWWRKYLPSTAQ